MMEGWRASRLMGYCPFGEPRGVLFSDLTRDLVSPSGGRIAEAVYDLPRIASEVDRDRLSAGRGQWEWSFLLPLRDFGNLVTLREGGTPLLRTQQLGERLGLRHLYVKDEARNPTGSFKDRGASVTVSKCREVGIDGLAVASSGNLACSLAAYAARGGLTFLGFIRKDTTDSNRLHCLVTGQRFFVVEGGMLQGAALAAQVAQRYGFFHAVQPHNLFRIEGKKTMAYEICRDLDWRVPDRVLIPSSGCTNVLALYKGFTELQALGWTDRLPALDVVQPAGCAPVVDAWAENRSVSRSAGPGTCLLGMGHPFPAAGDQAVRIMRLTGGRGVTVGDTAALDAQRLVASTEGLFYQPACTTCIAALADPANLSWVQECKNQVIVWIGTGTGKNQLVEPLARLLPPLHLRGSLEEFVELNPDLERRVAGVR